MSKYKFEFGVATDRVGSKVSDTVDLVRDWGYTEEELAGNLEDILDRELDTFVTENIESWVRRIDG